MSEGRAVSIFVPGIPAPQGSAKAFVVKRRDGSVRANVTHDNERTVPWRDLIRGAVLMDDPRRNWAVDFMVAPVAIDCEFLMPRRKREPKITPAHTRKPDTDKLVRALLDALTDLIYHDDAQVVEIRARKRTARPDEATGMWVSWREYRQPEEVA